MLVTQFEVVHEKRYHLFVVSRDMDVFEHIHPEQQPDGRWKIQVTLPKPGYYQLLSDFLPTGGSPQFIGRTVETADFDGDLESQTPHLVPDTVLTKTVGSMTAHVEFEPSILVEGQFGHLMFTLTDAKTGRLVTDLQPYLGAFGHALILSEDMRDYVHSHPFEGPDSDISKGSGGPTVTFEGYMPKAGPIPCVESVPAEWRGHYRAVHAECLHGRGGGKRCIAGRPALDFRGFATTAGSCDTLTGRRRFMTCPRLPGLRIVHTCMATLVGILAMSALGKAADPTTRPVTFSKDVAPILQEKCQQCHQPNSIAPMSLITYEDARPWARSIKQRVITRQMPPWHIDPSVGVHEFKNDMSLSDAQIDTIVRWVDAGAPEGDPKDMPPPKPLITDNEWQGCPRRLRSTRSRHQVIRVHDAGAASGRLVPADERHSAHRAALGEAWSRFVRPI